MPYLKEETSLHLWIKSFVLQEVQSFEANIDHLVASVSKFALLERIENCLIERICLYTQRIRVLISIKEHGSM